MARRRWRIGETRIYRFLGHTKPLPPGAELRNDMQGAMPHGCHSVLIELPHDEGMDDGANPAERPTGVP